jgi:alpha-1,3-rhamnosyl/mannosyltransferase
MRVVINCTSGAGSKTGIGHYTAQLLRCLPAVTAGEEMQIERFPQGWLAGAHALTVRLRPLLEARRPGAAGKPRPSGTPATPPQPSWRSRLFQSIRSLGQRLLQRHFRRLCARRGYDLYHEPNFIPLPGDLPTVATLHDLSAILYPQWHPADRVAYYERRFRDSLRQCTHFLTVSEFARREILRTLGLRPEQVTRTYNGIRPDLRPLPTAEVQATLQRLGLPPRYLLYLGTLEPRKNVLMLLRVYCSLPAEVRERWPLVLVGGWGWNTAELAEYLDTEARHHNVRHVGYLPDEAVPALYNGARALVFPSFYEGFGLPPLEMMACGGAVLASTAGALVETAGSRAHLLDPWDEDGWRQALLRITDDDDWWQSLREGVTEVARPFTWERCAQETWQVYRRVLGLETPMKQAG